MLRSLRRCSPVVTAAFAAFAAIWLVGCDVAVLHIRKEKLLVVYSCIDNSCGRNGRVI